MRLDSIELTNFRCFDSLKLDLHPRLNVFVGVNGSGKTALLEAIRAALGAFFTGFEYDDVEQFYLNERDVRLEYRGITKIEHRPVKISCSAEIGNHHNIQWRREFNKRTTSSMEHIGEIWKISKQMSDDIRTNKEVELPLLFYFSTQRLWAERKDYGYRANGNPFLGYFNSLNAKSSPAIFIDWFKRQEQHEFQNSQMGLGKDFSQLELVRKIAVKCLPDCKRLYFNAVAGELFVQFSDHDLPVSLLSDGQITLLLLCTRITLQCVLLNSYLGEKANEAKGAILIDEVDLHLHPAWQRMVIPSLLDAFPNVQFFITTHSPQVISSVPKESLFILKDNKVSRGIAFSEGRDSNSILYDILGDKKRPIAFEQQLDEFYESLEKEEEEKAVDRLEKLEEKWGNNDVEIVQAKLYLNDLKNESAK